MGKTSKWFRGLLGWKKSDQRMETTAAKPSKDKRSWSFVKSYREKDRCNEYSYGVSAKHRDQSITTARKDIAVRSIESVERVDPDKHAIAVAAATAAVAEAAVAAAHAAAAVVRLTNNGRCGNGPGNASGSIQIREVMAAVKIQAAFRGCLARRALRALRGLVRLQALVRGHIERKRTSEWLLRMQAILRAQTRARAGRAQISEFSLTSSKPSSHFHPPGPATPEKFERDARLRSLKFDQSSMAKPNWKILFHSSEHAQAFDHQSTMPLKFSFEGEEGSYFTPVNSPQLQKRSPFTPTKSDGSSYLSGFSDYPNYMAFTESSKAKIRSLSAPRQRPQFERSLSTKRSPGQSNGDHSTTQNGALQANFTNKAYPGSGRLDRLGMPVMPVGHRY